MHTQDCLMMTGLEYRCSIGAYKWEREILQKILIDIELDCDVSQCTDSLADTIDYAKISTFIGDELQGRHFSLIEELANYLASRLHAAFRIPAIRLCVHKPHALNNAKDVAIRIQRRF